MWDLLGGGLWRWIIWGGLALVVIVALVGGSS